MNCSLTSRVVTDLIVEQQAWKPPENLMCRLSHRAGDNVPMVYLGVLTSNLSPLLASGRNC